MSDQPLVREREPIERVRARLEALVMANAAPRCGARSKRTGKPCLLFNAETCRWTILGDAAEVLRSDSRGKILGALSEATELMTHLTS